MKEPFHPHQHPHLALYNEIIMMILAFIGGALFVVRELANLTHDQIVLLDRIDMAIVCIFLLEFFAKWYLTKNKKGFFRRYWWELLGAIPLTNSYAQALRVIRLLRIVRVIIHVRILKNDIQHYKVVMAKTSA